MLVIKRNVGCNIWLPSKPVFSELYPILCIPELSMQGTLRSLTRRDILQEYSPSIDVRLSGVLVGITRRFIFKEAETNVSRLAASGTLQALTRRNIFKELESTNTSLAASGTLVAATRRHVLSYAEYNPPASLEASGTLLNLTRQGV